jgi:hypothetical protein
MAGTAFYSGMMPGLASMMGKMSDESVAAKGFKYGADANKAIAEAGKARWEMRTGQEDREAQQNGIDMNLAGMHGVPLEYIRALKAGGDTSAYGIKPEVQQAVMRDYGAFRQGKPTDVSTYHTSMAKIPQEQANSAAAIMQMDALKSGKMPTKDDMNILSAVRNPAQIGSPEERLLEMYMKDPTKQPIMERYFGSRRSPDAPYVGMGNGAMGNKFTGEVTGGKITLDELIAKIAEQALKNRGAGGGAPGNPNAPTAPKKTGAW